MSYNIKKIAGIYWKHFTVSICMLLLFWSSFPFIICSLQSRFVLFNINSRIESSSSWSQNAHRNDLDQKGWCCLTYLDTQIFHCSVSGSIKALYLSVAQAAANLNCAHVEMSLFKVGDGLDWFVLGLLWAQTTTWVQLYAMSLCYWPTIYRELKWEHLVCFPKGFWDNDFECLVWHEANDYIFSIFDLCAILGRSRERTLL